MTDKGQRATEIVPLIAVPLVLITCAYFQWKQSALLTLGVVIAALLVFFAGYERSKPGLRQIMPAVVLASLAAAGRVLFMAVPSVQPVSAICIVAGVVFGRRSGFMVGALAALVSNFFLGQGAWTPWQMYAWGMMGYFAGVLVDQGFFERKAVPYLYSFLAPLAYGFLLNTWFLVGFVNPLTWQSATLAYTAGFTLDVVHAVSTVIFFTIIYLPWRKKLERIKRKYVLR